MAMVDGKNETVGVVCKQGDIMDGYGIVIFIIGLVGYLILRKRSPGWATAFAWVCGVGAGIFIGAIRSSAHDLVISENPAVNVSS